MSNRAGRVPAAIVVVSLLLATFVSAGSAVLVAAIWLMVRARQRDQLRGCLMLGCGTWFALGLIAAMVMP